MVSDTHIFPPSIHTNYCLGSESVSNFDYQEARQLIFASSVPRELLPPPPKIFFGRDKLIEDIVHLAEGLAAIGLIGAGGIGKTSIALTVLHDDRIKQRFGENRVFLRCDEFQASHAHFLRRLSSITGAGIENPEDLSTLRPFLSSKEMLVVLANVESILDPERPNAQEIYYTVDELTRFSNICLCITSRISTIPRECRIFDVPILTTEAANTIFYQIYKHRERSDAINNILDQLDFHPLSITLLATTARVNGWDARTLTMEWDKQCTGVLRTQHSGSLAATIELSLASPTFRELGPVARSLLEVVAFFPQGANEKNVGWLFPTIPYAQNTLGEFCNLSLTYQSDGFVTMLAPMRDYLRLKDPASSSLLAETKERYFARLSGSVNPGQPGLEETQWITTEDVNIEHLLDVFTKIDANSDNVWAACSGFMNRLYWHKPRLVTLGPKIEALPDNRPAKAQCLWDLSRLFKSVGNHVGRKRLLARVLELRREQGDSYAVALTLRDLSDVNRRAGLYEEGIRQAKEAYEIGEQLGDAATQAKCLKKLASLLREDNQLDPAEEAAIHAIDLIGENGDQFLLCESHRVLGDIYDDKLEAEKAIHHFETASLIASSLNHTVGLFWIHYRMAQVYSEEDEFEDAQTHLERARSYVADNMYLLAHAGQQQARLWGLQGMFQAASDQALKAIEVFESLGAANDVEATREFLGEIEIDAIGLDYEGEPLETIPLAVHCVHSSYSDGIAEALE